MFTQLFFNAEELVVFGESVGTCYATGFDLEGMHSDGKVSNEWIFGFAGPVADNGGIVVELCEFNDVEGFGECSDLVGFDEDGVGDVL